ncbi:dynein regulatory complex protein 1 [Enoplosus armatus]|uniref:dynein regulatory complex protein 1 n=1 Tax=Enoplosus armatus TaxID=215367 RepID=UPI0039946036
MADVDKDPEEASEPSVLSQNQEAKNGLSTQEVEEDPSVELKEEPWERQPQEEEEEEESDKLITLQRIVSLQRDLPTSVTNILTAADARELIRRRESEEACRLTLEQLETDEKSLYEKFEEVAARWATSQELQEELKSQRQLCAAIIKDKRKRINDLQQELKVRDDRIVKDLRQQAEELDLIKQRMEDPIKTLIEAYREELAQIERIYLQQCEVLLTKDKTEWAQRMKKLCDKQLERLMQWKKKMEESEAAMCNLMLETTEKHSVTQMEENAKFQVLERELQQRKDEKCKKTKQIAEIERRKASLSCMKKRTVSLQTEISDLKTECTNQEKQFKKRSQHLSEDYKRSIQQYERMQKKIKHFAVADSRRFEEMWLMMEEELKQLVERALFIDSEICRHLGVPWKRPSMAFMERSGPIQPQKQAEQALQCSERVTDASVGPRLETDTESTDMEMNKEETAVQSKSGVEVEEGKLETLKKVMELLCDEAGFLLEDKLLNLLVPLEKEKQTVVKLGSLLCTFGIGEEDVPKLANFLLKYKHQQRELTEDVCVESGESSDSTTHLTSELIDRNLVVPALRSFLDQLTRSRESSARQHINVQHVKARDASEDKAYWESMGNIISDDRLKLWDAAEKKLKQHHAVLTEIRELVPETQSLKQQNAELKMLLQQTLNSKKAI